MAYIINTYNNEQITIVQDGTLDQTTDLKLVAKIMQVMEKYKMKILFFC